MGRKLKFIKETNKNISFCIIKGNNSGMILNSKQLDAQTHITFRVGELLILKNIKNIITYSINAVVT
jgi:predicted acetyltransferase